MLMELFSSIQGEGIRVGKPSTFVRFGGCNLHCVHPSTMVTMADYTQKPISEIAAGDLVLGIKHVPPNRQKLVIQKVKKVWTTNKPGYQVDYGVDKLICSEDHRIYSTRRHDYAYVKNCDGSGGKYIPPRDKAITNEYRKGYLAGAIYGDGWIGTSSYLQSSGSVKTTRAFNFVVQDKVFAKRITRYGRALGFNIMDPVSCREKYWRVSSHNTEFMDMVREYDKKTEVASFNLTNAEFFRGFCAGFFDAEGCWQGSNNGLSITQTRDIALMKQITKKLSQFNARLIVRDNPIALSGELFNINLGSTKDAFDFVMWCNPAIKRKWRVFAKNFPSRVVPMKVSKLPVYEGVLYDIQTETENFFANGLLVHNCSWCDEPESIPIRNKTNEEKYGHERTTPRVIFDSIKKAANSDIVFTGGEPLIQPAFELAALAEKIKSRRSFITVETNGTMFVPEVVPFIDLWSFSPKLSSSDNVRPPATYLNAIAQILEAKPKKAHAQLKFVIGSWDDIFDMKKYFVAFPKTTVFLQAVWKEDVWEPTYSVLEMQKMCEKADIDFKHTDIRFGVQLHKYCRMH
jgi:organic radical activating enzyme